MKMKTKPVTLAEASLKMNPGDCFSPDCDSMYGDFIMNKNGTFRGAECENPSELVLSKNHLAVVGKIKPFLRRVLTGDEWINSVFKEGAKIRPANDSIFRIELKKAFNDGHQNGRLERDIELAGLTGAVHALYKIADHEGVSTYTQAVFNEFDKIPK